MSPTSTARVPPFWTRIPRFFLYPFYPAALVMLFAVAFLTALLPGGFLGLLGGVLVFAVYIKYAFWILEYTAQGHLKPPSFSAEFLFGDYSVLLKQIAIYLLAGGLFIGVTQVFGVVLGIVFALLALLALPASIMVLATTESLTRAINPGVLWALIRAVGWPYLILYGFLFLLSISNEAANQFLTERAGARELAFVLTLASSYFTFIMYNMMGYVIFQYHEALGFELAEDADAAPGVVAAPVYEGMELVERFVAEEKFAAAIEQMRSIVRSHPGDVDLLVRFHRLMRLNADAAQFDQFGPDLIQRLLDANRNKEASEVYLDCVKMDPSFKPEARDHYLPLALSLRAYDHKAQAIGLLNGFHRSYPDDPLIPELYLLVAQIFIDDLRQEGKAVPVLDFLRKRFPRHRLQPQITALREAIGETPAGP
jgi:hypothetical protein